MIAFWILKNAYAIPKITVQIDERADRLRSELTDAELEVVEDAGDAGRRRRRTLRRAVPAGAVLAVGEDADAEHAEEAADAVHRDRAHRVVDALLLDEDDRFDRR